MRRLALRGMLKTLIDKTKTMRNKQSKQQHSSALRHLKKTRVLIVLGCFAAGAIAVPLVHADQFDVQIQQLQQQNSQTQGVVDQLQSQASSYQDAINKLQSQVNSLQSDIDANEAKQADLQSQIQAAQTQLDQEKKILADDIQTMYIDGKATTIEMLATSKNLSDFVDKQEYRSAVQNKLQATLATITALQNQLKSQQEQVTTLLQSQKVQQAQIDADEQQQAQLLSYNESQQAQYNQQIQANQSKIGDLRQQQAILNAKYNIGAFKTSADHGGYPDAWNNAPQDSLVDPWGMYNRECVSFTAFKVHEDFLAGKNNRDMPNWGGIGNADQWDDDARASGIPVDNNPTPGSIAISNAGAFGHAMYVVQSSTINGQQAIYVEQYNANLDGQYSEGWRYTTGLSFLHF